MSLAVLYAGPVRGCEAVKRWSIQAIRQADAVCCVTVQPNHGIVQGNSTRGCIRPCSCGKEVVVGLDPDSWVGDRDTSGERTCTVLDRAQEILNRVQPVVRDERVQSKVLSVSIGSTTITPRKEAAQSRHHPPTASQK